VPVTPTPTGGTIIAPVLGVNVGIANNLLQQINILQQNINIDPTIINNQVVNNINNINTITTVNNQVIQNTVINNPQGVVVKPAPQVVVVNKLALPTNPSSNSAQVLQGNRRRRDSWQPNHIMCEEDRS
jgi:hypothetical protein